MLRVEMRLSDKGLQVLRYCWSRTSKPVSGTELSKALGISSGTLYPMLARFEQNGLFTSEWESVDPSEVGRPRKRLYRITGAGCDFAQAALSKVSTIPEPKEEPIPNPEGILT